MWGATGKGPLIRPFPAPMTSRQRQGLHHQPACPEENQGTRQPADKGRSRFLRNKFYRCLEFPAS